MSKGTSVLGSITSSEMPSPARSSAASSGLVDHLGQGDHGHIGAFSPDGGLAEGNEVLVFRHLALHAAQE